MSQLSRTHAGRTFLVTGANSGVGLTLTRRLLADGGEVIALIRSDFEPEPALQTALAAGQLRSYRADFADFASLRQALAEIRSHESSIDVLFNNAAGGFGQIQTTSEGHEAHFQINTLVPYIILAALEDLLERGKLKTVINTSSNALLFVRDFSLDLLEHPRVYKPLTGPYGASKMALSLWTEAIAPELALKQIEIRSACPGPNRTKMTAGPGMPRLLLLLRGLIFKAPEHGAQRLYEAAFGHPGSSGVFLNKNRSTELRFSKLAPAVLQRVKALYVKDFLEQSTPAQV